MRVTARERAGDGPKKRNKRNLWVRENMNEERKRKRREIIRKD